MQTDAEIRTAYLATRTGHWDRHPTGCRVWRKPPRNGGYVHCWDPVTKRVALAHRLAWIAAHGSIPEGLQVLHGCDNPTCCRVAEGHLHLGTIADNMREKMERGRTNPQKGEASKNAKLTTAKVVAIRAAAREGEPQASIAARFGVSQVCIHFVVTRKTWDHVE